MKKTLIIAALVAGVSCVTCTGAVVVLGLVTDDGVVGPPPSAAPNPASGALRDRIIGTWNRKAARGCPLNDIACMSTDPGVTRHWYAFAADGTYVFDAEYLPNFSSELYFQHETGTWELDGDQLTLTPEESRWEKHGLNDGSRKAGGPLLKEGENPLDAVTYRARLHFFSGINEWNLILTTGGEGTKRDGTFALHPDFPASYLLSPGR